MRMFRTLHLRPSTLTFLPLSRSHFADLRFVSSYAVNILPVSRRPSERAMSNTALKPEEVEKEGKHLANGDAKVNNWSDPGVAAFDFRSTHPRQLVKA